MKKKRPGKFDLPVSVNISGQPQTLPVSKALTLLNSALKDKQYPAVIQAAIQLLDQQPGNDNARLVLYRALSAAEQFHSLDEHCRNQLARKPRDVVSLEYRAHALRQQAKEEEALPLLEKAVDLAKTNARLINTLGTAYKELGHMENALDCFQRATAIKPLLGKAYWNRSDLVAEPAGEIETLEKNLRRLPTESKELPYFHFSLFRLYEKLGDFDSAFHHLAKGNAAKKTSLHYDVEPELKAAERICQFFRSNYGAIEKRIDASTVPFSDYPAIFIVGMPRSGTSLVEQILASHSQVAGGGELPLLTRATETLLQSLKIHAPFPECLNEFDAGDYARLGQLYQEQAAPFLRRKPALTDKYLLNYRVIPLIRLALPNAKIIHVRRDPMDTCFGCYRQLFNTGLGFCYDLEDIAKTWRSYQHTMAVWQELLPDEFYTCEYEHLVTDQKTAIKQLLKFCELPWDENCLNFHATERTVKTASSLQVREPVFRHGIGRWKKYEKELASLEKLVAGNS